MVIREPHVQGRFYPGRRGECVAALDRCLEAARVDPEVKGPFLGGIVPHAGWMYSGPTAAHVYKALVQGRPPMTFILLGAVHDLRRVPLASVDTSEAWRTPLGDALIDQSMARRLLEALEGDLQDAPGAHAQEHSLEVQVPFIQHRFPEARIVPIAVPPDGRAARLGEGLARTTVDIRDRMVVLGSSDLTHYGPRYLFTPEGTGPEALTWVREKNDRRIVDLILGLRDGEIVEEADQSQSACGAGAIAATVAYCRAAGARGGRLLHYTTSHDVLPEGPPANFVGYSGIVF